MTEDPSLLNPEQREVVLHGDGPCLVLAGAGSGKTRTITYRVAHLLSQGILPEQILLVTFTNKAAREMMMRVNALVGDDARLPWAGTFHHIAYKMLKTYASLLGYQSNFTILDSADSLDVIKACIKHEGIDRANRRFPSASVLQSIISYARNAEATIVDVLDLKYPSWVDIADTISRIAEDYRRRKAEANAMDFDDLLVNLQLLLAQSEPIKKRFADQFRYVLVDEYQDTNKIQASLIRLLASAHRNILVVGDDAQSIYSFRAADIKNILDFEKQYPNARVFRLETNYRSTPDILDLANDVIAQNRAQYQKELKSIQRAFTKPEVHAFADDGEEAQFIAERILEIKNEGVPLPHIAVLFRAAFHSQALEMELVKRNIPYDYRGGVRFFERAHVKDVLAYLRIFANKNDAIAWNRVLTMQTGIGVAGAGRVVEVLMDPPVPPLRGEEAEGGLERAGAARGAGGRGGWGDFLSVWREMEKKDGSPSALIRAVIGSQYQEYLETEYPDYRDRVEDLEQLAVFAERTKDLSEFLAESTMQENYQAIQTGEARDGEEKIILSTIHQAKGLEWDTVFILGMAKGKFPNDRAFAEANGIEEERRLFYVAITRAKRLLYVTYPMMAGFQSILQGPSLFLEDIDRDLIDHHSFADDVGSSIFSNPSDETDDIVYVAEDGGWEKNKRSFLKDIEEL